MTQKKRHDWFLVALCSWALYGCSSQGTLTIVLDSSSTPEPVFLELVVVMPWHEEGIICDELLALESPLHSIEISPGFDVLQGHGIALDSDVMLPEVGSIRDGAFVAARARDDTCHVVSHGCTQLRYGRGDQEVRLQLQPLEGGTSCSDQYRCEDGSPGECIRGNCLIHADCWDMDPATTNHCVEDFCSPDPDVHDGSPSDADEDGRTPPLEDCDDLDNAVPSSEPICGEARDHDCDGAIDDLDGCGVPDCERYEIIDITPPSTSDPLLFGHRAKHVFVSGQRVVATLVGTEDSEPIVVWRGSLSSDGTLESVGAIPLGLTEHFEPLDMAVVEDTAFITHRTAIAVIDLSDPTLPSEALLGQLETPEDNALGFRRLYVAAPFLFVASLRTILQYDASWRLPSKGWPVFVGTIQTYTTSIIEDMTSRHGRLFATSFVSKELEMLKPLWDASASGERELGMCFDLEETDAFPWGSTGHIEAIAVSQDGVVFMTAAHSIHDGVNQRFLYRLRNNGTDQYLPDLIGSGDVTQALSIGDVNTLGDTAHLSVVGRHHDTGNLVIRTTKRGDEYPAQIFLHSAQHPESWTTLDMEDTVMDVAVVGDQILLAAETQGLLTGRLVCVQ